VFTARYELNTEIESRFFVFNGRAMAQAGLSPWRHDFDSMWDLWCTKWHWDRFFSEYFGFPFSVSFH